MTDRDHLPCNPSGNPFGTSITRADIGATMEFLEDWEQRYQYIIDLGKSLPSMPEADRTDDSIVRGCQSQVWLNARKDGDRFWFQADSDAFIVKGLLGVILSAYNGQTASAVLAFDIDGYLAQLDLLRHLSSARSNGLRPMIERIRSEAASQH